MLKACFGLATFGALVSPSQSRVGDLLADDVVLLNGSLQIRIRGSKTNVLGRDVSGFPFMRLTGSFPGLFGKGQVMRWLMNGSVWR